MSRNAGVAARVQARLLASAAAGAGGGGAGGAGIDGARVAQLAREEAPILPDAALDRLVDEVVADVTGLGPLESLLADPAVTEIMVNGSGPVWVERAGQLEPTGITLTAPTVFR